MRMRKLGLLAMLAALLLPTTAVGAPATVIQGQTSGGAIVPVLVGSDGTVQTSGGGGGGGTSSTTTIPVSPPTNPAGTTGVPFYSDPNGSLRVSVPAGISTTNASTGATGAAVPAQATYIAGLFGGNLIPWLMDASGRGTVNINGTVATSLSTLPALTAGSAVIGHVIADSGSTTAVTSLPAIPAGTNVIGHVIADSGSTTAVTSLPSLPAGSNTVGGVTNIPSAAGGISTYCFAGGTGNALLTSTVVQVGSTAAHSLYGVDFVNTGASTVYVQVFDLASGSVTLGTTVPKIVKWIPAGGAWEEKWSGENRLLFGTAISFAATTTPTGNTAPGTALLGNVEYL